MGYLFDFMGWQIKPCLPPALSHLVMRFTRATGVNFSMLLCGAIDLDPG